MLKDNTLKCVLSHWPLANWPGRYNGIYHLHGQTLNSMKTDLDIMNRVNVCTDNWNFTPQPLIETLNMLKKRGEKQQNTLGSEE